MHKCCFVNIFENAQIKLITTKTAKIAFFDSSWLFLVCFQTYRQKDICASIVFKAESKPKHEEKHFWGFFFKNQKRAFSEV